MILKKLAGHFKKAEEFGALYADVKDVLNAFMAGLKFSGTTS